MKRVLLCLGAIALVNYSYAQQQPIVGGNSTNITEVPYQVALLDADGKQFCGGSIINETWILTAAHCVVGGDPNTIYILAGQSALDGGGGQKIQGKTLEIHPLYNAAKDPYDLALLEIKSPLSYNTSVQPVALATKEDEKNGVTNEGVMAKVSGWGSTGSSSSNDLQSVYEPLITDELAAITYPGRFDFTMIAAGYKEGGKGSCQGDSGGPLVVDDKGTKKQVGVVSWGEGCAKPDRYSVYARVAYFQEWINNVIEGKAIPLFLANLYYELGQITFQNKTAQTATYTWSLTGPASTTSNSTNFSYNFTIPGDYELQLSATNAKGTLSIKKGFKVLSQPTACQQSLLDTDNISLDKFTFENNNVTSTNFTKCGFITEYYHPGKVMKLESFKFYVDSVNGMMGSFFYTAAEVNGKWELLGWYPVNSLTKGYNSFSIKEIHSTTLKEVYLRDTFRLAILFELIQDSYLSLGAFDHNGAGIKGAFRPCNEGDKYYNDHTMQKNIVPAIYAIGCMYDVEKVTATNSEAYSNTSVLLYPNPSSGIINLQTDMVFHHYTVVNQLGKVVANGVVENNAVNVDGLDKGMYFLKLESDHSLKMTGFQMQ